MAVGCGGTERNFHSRSGFGGSNSGSIENLAEGWGGGGGGWGGNVKYKSSQFMTIFCTHI